MTHTSILELASQPGQKISVTGWVETIRSHGKLAFVDIRDRSAKLQAVSLSPELSAQITALHTQDLITLHGTLNSRPEKLINHALSTGTVELLIESVEVVTSAAPLPFELDKDTKPVDEVLRLQHRYLDLRTDRMRSNLEMRHKMNLFFRNYLSGLGFWEVETPNLTKGTPEGSREYIVPSRIHPGNFYVLPQSPQQFKQLLMVGGVEKYFQIARCFRDEDQRGDRQPEFTQLDMEMSFIEQEDILQLVETMMVEFVKAVFPDKQIMQTPFPRMTYAESMEKYGTDKPDLRTEKDINTLAFAWVLDFPLFESTDEGGLASAHHPFTHPHPEDMELASNEPLKARALAYDLVLNGFELGSGSIRIHEAELQQRMFTILGLSEEQQQLKFGHMLKAFSFSPPPHGGIAFGLDRLIAILMGEENIREVIAFPKTGDAKDPLTGAPAPVTQRALEEAHVLPVIPAPKKTA